MESLIQIINNLQEVSKAIGDDEFRLPRIVTVGSQGSGKSSVLESLVGRSFLPKGPGVVTRTPLVLHLVHSRKKRRGEDGISDVEEYGVFLHSDAIFTDFDEISGEIQRQTEKIAGTGKGIGEEEITLKLYSPRVADMTLVDLPGLAKLPVGDQPPDIETRIRNLVLKYIDNTDAIIMAVLAADKDMATYESLKLAEDVDPKGERTLAVLTMADLMDAGTDATDILLGRVVPVKLGIVAVINRSQKDIDDNKPMEQAYEHEAQFLRVTYPSLADLNGRSCLVATLKKLLMQKSQNYLLNVNTRVKLKISQSRALVDFYSDHVQEQNRGLFKIVLEFASAYSAAIKASAENIKSPVVDGEQSIYHVLYETFKTALNENKFIYSKEDILKLLSDGSHGRGPEEILENLAIEPIHYLRETSLRCAKLVLEEMKQLLWKCAHETDTLLVKFSALRSKILVILEDVLRRGLVNAENVIRVNNFCDLRSRITRILSSDKKNELLSREEFEKESAERKCDVIVNAWESYYQTALKTVHDDVTATLMQNLVNYVKSKVHYELKSYFASPGSGRPFHDAQDFAPKRIHERKALEALYGARKILEELNTSNANCDT